MIGAWFTALRIIYDIANKNAMNPMWGPVALINGHDWPNAKLKSNMFSHFRNDNTKKAFTYFGWTIFVKAGQGHRKKMLL